MHLVSPITTYRPREAARPTPPTVQRARRLLLSSLGAAALAAAVAGQSLALLTGHSGVDMVVACVLAQLPVLAVVVAECRSLVELGSRAEDAQAALDREHDRVHEMRATLAAVSTAHRVLHDPRADLDPRRKDRLQRLHDAEMARLERLLVSRREQALGMVDLDAVIEPLVEASALRGVPVRWSPGGTRAIGRADDVAEAVHVLLENAARHAAGQDVSIAVAVRGREVDVRVADHGPGVPDELLDHVFERRARRAGSPGDGLGLDIARRLADQMGGRLWLAPPAPGGTGSTFVLTLVAHSGAQSCLVAPS